MIACVGRTLRLSLAVAFVSGLGFAATNANAQFVDTDVTCADPNSVADSFNDAFQWAFLGGEDSGKCNKLCKSYSSKCKNYVKDAASCLNRAAGDNAELNKKAFCEPLTDNTAKKDCKELEKDAEKSEKQDIKSNRDANLTVCDDIESPCIPICEAGVVP